MSGSLDFDAPFTDREILKLREIARDTKNPEIRAAVLRLIMRGRPPPYEEPKETEGEA